TQRRRRQGMICAPAVLLVKGRPSRIVSKEGHVDLTIIQMPSNEGRAGTQSLVARCDVDVDMDRIAEGIFERRLGHLKRVMVSHWIVARSSKACVVECRHNGYTSGATWQADGNDHQGSEKDQMQGSV